jgi:hypothetical protein
VFLVENIGRNMLPCMINLQLWKGTSFLWEIRKNGLIFCRIHMTFEKPHGFYKNQPPFSCTKIVFLMNILMSTCSLEWFTFSLIEFKGKNNQFPWEIGNFVKFVESLWLLKIHMDPVKKPFKKRVFFVENIGRNMLPCMINLRVGKEASFIEK